MNAVEAEASVPETPTANVNASVPSPPQEIGDDGIDVQGIESERMCSDASTSMTGIMKIVPEVDVSLRYQVRNAILVPSSKA